MSAATLACQACQCGQPMTVTASGVRICEHCDAVKCPRCFRKPLPPLDCGQRKRLDKSPGRGPQ